MRVEKAEQNKLVAEFMGLKKMGGTAHAYYCKNGIDAYSANPDEPVGPIMKYRTSWDWLMPVVEKISSHVYEIEKADEYSGVKEIKHRAFLRTFGPGEGEWMVRFNRCGLHCAPTLIEAAYKACVEFIEWHNKQNTPA